MNLNKNNIQKIVEELIGQVNTVNVPVTNQNTGELIWVGDGVCEASGLDNVMLGEIVNIENKVKALVLNLNRNSVGMVVLGDSNSLKVGNTVYTTGILLSVPVSKKLIGHVVDPVGRPLDSNSAVIPEKNYPLEKIAPGVIGREGVNAPMLTGLKTIDALTPIGRGQRQLIIGDRGTGKSSVAITSIINQKDKDLICIYVAIGQKNSFIAQTINTFNKFGAMEHTIVVSASASDSAVMQYLAPYAGTAIAEYFLDQGKDVLVVYDDLSKHAWAYREISLLLKRPSGREAYPGDVFYLHSRLLERACHLNKNNNGGSITALPIIETLEGDLSSYIPTNVISITDGQIYLEPDLFNADIRPAMNVGLSVSRVGGDAQTKAMKQVAGKIRLELAQYRELAAFSQFSSDLDPETKARLDRGARLTEVLKQKWDDPYSIGEQVIVIWAATSGYLDSVPTEKAKEWEEKLVEYLRQKYTKIIKKIDTAKDKLTDKELMEIGTIIGKFNETLGSRFIANEEKK